MSSPHPGFKRVFIWQTRAWNHQPDDHPMIVFGLLDPYGKFCSKMVAKWDDKEKILLEVSQTNWVLMPLFRGVYTRMAKVARLGISEERFALMLSECGFRDITPYQRSDTRMKLETELLALNKRMRELQKWLDSFRAET